MKVENTKINIQSLPQDNQRNPVFSDKKIFKSSEIKQKEDLSNNGKFDKSEALKNFWEGIKKPFKEVRNYAKENPAQFITICAAGIGLTILSTVCPPAGYILTGVGCYFIGNPLVKGVKKIHNAKTGDDKEKAFTDFGESASYTALTFGTNVLTKMVPAPTVSKAVQGVNKGSKHTISFFSNATDISSFGPKVQEFLSMTGKGMRSSEISYKTGK